MRSTRLLAIGCTLAAITALLAGCTAAPASPENAMPRIVPQPATVSAQDGGRFELTSSSRIVASGDGGRAIAEFLGERLRTATGYELAVSDGTDAGAHDISLAITPDGTSAEPEAYGIRSSTEGMQLTAATAEGLFRGAQTVRQLFDPTIEGQVPVQQDWTAPAVTIADHPRFAYRGAGLDVARHFFSVADVKRYIDDIALLKINFLHLHLTDDQGWRIQIDAWPKLTEIGGTGAVGLASGGFYTKADYAEIVAYAASRFITIVPEIDLPGHTNAALASYPELNCDGVAPAPYTGIEVGFSSLCIDKDVTYTFVSDVLRELAAMTPGPYLHLGGDESLSTPPADFERFIQRVTTDAAAQTGKTIIGWHEMGKATGLPAGTIGQYWSFVQPQEGAEDETRTFVNGGGKIIYSPADVAYLDMIYDDDTRFGLSWANGPTSVHEAYMWDPTEIVDGIGEKDILGVEAPIWTETLTNMDDVEYMAFPRLGSIAEIAWSPAPKDGKRDWDAFAPRAVALCNRLAALGVGFYHAPELPWD